MVVLLAATPPDLIQHSILNLMWHRVLFFTHINKSFTSIFNILYRSRWKSESSKIAFYFSRYFIDRGYKQ